MNRSFLLIFLAIFYCSVSYSQIKDEAEFKKKAEAAFEEEQYNEAYKYYAQLVSLYPKDPEYNYRLGVCMLFTEPDKKKPFSYLQIATKNLAEAPKEAIFYLGKAYHINYKFDEAIKYYTEYKKTASSSNIKKLQVDREIEACRNGKRLLSNLSDLIIMSKKQLNEADYFRSYETRDIGGKLLVKPDDFKSGYDKKKKDKSVVYLPRSGERVYYSSYGDNGDKGRDIYFVNRLPNGSWSKPQPMPAPINTIYDEDYPFLHPNGKTLYFSSKGHNSMGGYDIFKTTFNESTQTWSKPENLDFPINSPDDDILFVTDSLEKTAYFSTGRYSPYGKIDVLKINTERKPLNFAVLKGTVVKEDAAQSLKSKITVKNIENGEIVGTYQAGDNGDYNMELPNGGRFIFTVETPGLPTQSDGVNIPVAYTLKPYKQVISYDNKVLKIINYFDGQIPDENYSMMIDLIEKKAHLELSEYDINGNLKDAGIKNTDIVGNNQQGNLNSVSTTNPTVSGNQGVNNNSNSTNTPKNVTNDQLLKIAKDDAKEAQDEANNLKNEAQDAFGLATQKTAEATAKQKEADEAIKNANAITDVIKKNEELAKANDLKEEANIATNIANTATNLAKKLEVDANQKQKEADLTNEYIKELENVTKNKNNKEALAKLEQIQKQLDEVSNQKSQSDELVNSLKAESELKQTEIINSEKKTNAIVTEINTLKTEVKSLESDMAAENDKSIKENIAAQIREINNEIDSKNKELNTNNQKIESLQNQVEGLKKEIELASNIMNDKTDGVAVNNTSGNATNPDNTNAGNTSPAVALSSDKLIEKYTPVTNQNTAVTSSNDKTKLLEQNKNLTEYNNDIAKVIEADKKELQKTISIEQKQKLNDEIKKLEIIKNNNDQSIAANTAKIDQLSTTVTNNTNTTSVSGNNNVRDNTSASNQITALSSDKLEDKYESVVNQNTTIASGNDKQSLVEQNKNLNNYNAEITQLIEIDKKELAKTNNTEQKQKLNDEITKLESIKTANNELIITNTKKLDQLNSNIAANTNTNSISTNTVSNDNNSASNPIANNTSNTGNPGTNTDNSAYLNTLDKLKNSLNSSKEMANNVFAYNDYNESSSNALKQTASQKFEQSKQNSDNLNNLISQAENNIKSYTTSDPATIQNEAENLLNKAYELRKEAATKTGSEKDNLLKQAQEDEKLATTKKLDAAVAQKKQNQTTFDNNAANLKELQKLTGEKTSNEISQANMLIDEAAINFKQAQKIRSEADAYPTDAAKLGGIGNAEEKENEALLKQQKALELLQKVNPDFKAAPLTQNSPDNTIAGVNNAINTAAQSESDAYTALSKANQNELKLQGDKLQKNPGFKTSASAQELKKQSDNLNKEAQQFITQSQSAKTATEKADLLLKANAKEIAALQSLNEASKALTSNTGNTTVATNNNNASNNGNSNSNAINNNGGNNSVTNSTGNNAAATNTTNPSTNVVATSTTQTTAGNTTGTNSVAVNNTTPTTTVTPATSIEEIKTGLNNPKEASLTAFANYSNSEAVSLKEKAYATINSALKEDKNILTQLNSNTGSLAPDSNKINELKSEAEKLNDDASALRKNAQTKTSTEKENDLKKAKELDQQALSKKTEAATVQQQLNTLTYNTNNESLKELEQIAKDKNIAELNSVSAQLSEANTLMTQANNLRTEANAYPNDAAKLGGYSNAEEKEQQAIAKQQEALATYKKYFPDYKPKEVLQTAVNNNQSGNNITANTQKHIEGLNMLVQANDMEYNSRMTSLPVNLNSNQNNLKTKAQTSWKKSQDLIAQASQTNNQARKKELLTEATQNGQDAVNTLAQINAASSPVRTPANNNVATNNAGNTNSTINNGNINTPRNATTSGGAFKTNGLEVKTNNAYSASNPIPIDQKMPDGLIFKVQIGAFKAPLPDNTFKGLSPVIAQTAPNGYLRYMAGNFDKYETASGVKNDLKNLGYSDAFVVAYYNGQRITLAEALEKLKASGQQIDMATAANSSAGITANNNIPRNTFTTSVTNTGTADTQPAEITRELEQTNDLLYTVQIGVFSKQVTKGQLYNLRPIYTEKLPNGLYRYTAGIYNQKDKLLQDKQRVVDLGVKDAFVSAYYNARKIPFAEAQKLQAENNNLKLEPQNPIIFPGTAIQPTTNNTNTPVNNIANTPAVAPFSNGVTTGPAPTADNGVKTDDAGISFKVQIGAYKNQVPNDVASKFLNIKTWPVNNVVINGLYIYTIGNFNAVSFAKKLKDEAISLGITDAFITVYKDGKKLYGAEAAQYLNQ